MTTRGVVILRYILGDPEHNTGALLVEVRSTAPARGDRGPGRPYMATLYVNGKVPRRIAAWGFAETEQEARELAQTFVDIFETRRLEWSKQ